MSLTANQLYRDAASQFKQHFKPLILISLLSAFVTVILLKIFLPSTDPLSDFIQNGESAESLFTLLKDMSDDQRNLLMHISGIMTFSALIGNTLLVGGVLKYLAASAQGKSLSALRAIGASAPVWPRLLIQTFLLTLIVQLGFYVLIVPGVILMILFSLSPVLLLENDRGLIKTMKQSVPLVWKHMRLIAPAVIAWFAVRVALTFIFGGFGLMPASTILLISNLLAHLSSALLLIYLYRVTAQIR
ncbi:UPF0259 family protein [Rosenbergiella australiborealis]|uniref:UPF0259 membrane protein HGT73_02900 n=1 Tax=Rosenbergiella australiborealis TaxID=1544696 RepID=A0ABS5T1X6_9GAMM|nr:YciC family protein [Rosenbergiella australiborealis]MBT0726340.1 UPF0259 family protein [Rosenbergiella australiborealis]